MNESPEAPSAELQLQLEIGYDLADVTRLMRAAFDQRMRAVGLTGAAWRVISSLNRFDGQTQASLAHRLEISRVAEGESVDRLEKSGHVERKADPADRRVWRLHLTDLSKDLLPMMYETAAELHADCFRDLTLDDLARLKSTLEQLRERLLDIKIETLDEEAGR